MDAADGGNVVRLTPDDQDPAITDMVGARLCCEGLLCEGPSGLARVGAAAAAAAAAAGVLGAWGQARGTPAGGEGSAIGRGLRGAARRQVRRSTCCPCLPRPPGRQVEPGRRHAGVCLGPRQRSRRVRHLADGCALWRQPAAPDQRRAQRAEPQLQPGRPAAGLQLPAGQHRHRLADGADLRGGRGRRGPALPDQQHQHRGLHRRRAAGRLQGGCSGVRGARLARAALCACGQRRPPPAGPHPTMHAVARPAAYRPQHPAPFLPNLPAGGVFPTLSGEVTPAWSPDGERIAFASDRPRGPSGAPAYALYTMRAADGGDVQRVAADGDDGSVMAVTVGWQPLPLGAGPAAAPAPAAAQAAASAAVQRHVQRVLPLAAASAVAAALLFA